MNAPRDRHSNATAHLRSVSYGPLLYRRMVGRVDGSPADGDLVRVLDRASKPFGWAFYSAASQIALRMVSYGEAAPGESFLSERIARAVGLRRDVLRLDDVTDAYRLVHAEGDGLSGLVADRFGEYVVLELFSKAMFLRLGQIEDAFIDAGLTVRRFVRRADDEIARAEGFRMGKLADAPRCVTQITENGLKFEVDLTKGHKTGFFCDQRENRQALTHFTPGKSVLDMCCYSAGFSCYAAGPGRAADVTAVDIDETALETARRNVKLNRAAVDVRQSDAFDFLRYARRDGKSWDVVVLDPSKFVPSRDEMERGMRKYRDLNLLAAGVVKPGGLLLTCSCSGLVSLDAFVQTVSRACRSAGRGAQVFRVTGAAADHPVMSDAPESAYLKAVWARLD